MIYPDRQIIGYTRESFTIAQDVMSLLPLAPFVRIIPVAEAEMIKYFCNCFLAVKVAFANQIYDVCEKVRIDYDLIKESAIADRRFGRSHFEVWHKGSRGYGGMCLPKDMKAFLKFAKDLKVDLPTLIATDKYNDKLRGKNSKRNSQKGIENAL